MESIKLDSIKTELSVLLSNVNTTKQKMCKLVRTKDKKKTLNIMFFLENKRKSTNLISKLYFFRNKNLK